MGLRAKSGKLTSFIVLGFMLCVRLVDPLSYRNGHCRLSLAMSRDRASKLVARNRTRLPR